MITFSCCLIVRRLVFVLCPSLRFLFNFFLNFSISISSIWIFLIILFFLFFLFYYLHFLVCYFSDFSFIYFSLSVALAFCYSFSFSSALYHSHSLYDTTWLDMTYPHMIWFDIVCDICVSVCVLNMIILLLWIT